MAAAPGAERIGATLAIPCNDSPEALVLHDVARLVAGHPTVAWPYIAAVPAAIGIKSVVRTHLLIIVRDTKKQCEIGSRLGNGRSTAQKGGSGENAHNCLFHFHSPYFLLRLKLLNADFVPQH